jgi:hypothetical protein
MAPYVSFLTLFNGIFNSLGARFLPGFGFKQLQPTNIQPVYFPAWIIDAELELEISYGNTQVLCLPTIVLLFPYPANIANIHDPSF